METNSDSSPVLPLPDIVGAVPFKRFKFFLKNAFKSLFAVVKNREIVIPNFLEL